MSVSLTVPGVDELDELSEALASWQVEGSPVQLHPGDVGWNSRADRLAEQLRVWRRDGVPVAMGIFDDDVIRMAVSPLISHDGSVASALVADLASIAAVVEARSGSALRRSLREAGWVDDEPWAPLTRSLVDPVEPCGLRIERVTSASPGLVADRVEVHRASFPRSTFTVDQWERVAASAPYRKGRCLVAYDDRDRPVAAATVWSAGERRPGLIEPLGAHREHRGQGHGRAITLAAAAELRSMGASSVSVCTPAANTVGVAAYVSAGFTRQPDSRDFRRR